MINERASSGGGEHLSYDNASHEKLNAQTSRDCLSHHMHIPKKKTSPSTSSLGGNISEDSDLLEVESMLLPSAPESSSYQRSRSQSKYRHSVESNKISDDDYVIDSFTPPQHRSNQRPQTTFALPRQGHTNISGGNQSSVGGSQKIMTNNRCNNNNNSNNHTSVMNYYGPQINLNIHIGDSTMTWVFPVGLFAYTGIIDRIISN